jgi:hypothetical protein
VASRVALVLDLATTSRASFAQLVQRQLKSASENVIIAHIMQLAVPKQNGCQKCVAQLDTKANERKVLASQSSRTS